jgi:hypothetical protein
MIILNHEPQHLKTAWGALPYDRDNSYWRDVRGSLMGLLPPHNSYLMFATFCGNDISLGDCIREDWRFRLSQKRPGLACSVKLRLYHPKYRFVLRFSTENLSIPVYFSVAEVITMLATQKYFYGMYPTNTVPVPLSPKWANQDVTQFSTTELIDELHKRYMSKPKGLTKTTAEVINIDRVA